MLAGCCGWVDQLARFWIPSRYCSRFVNTDAISAYACRNLGSSRGSTSGCYGGSLSCQEPPLAIHLHWVQLSGKHIFLLARPLYTTKATCTYVLSLHVFLDLMLLCKPGATRQLMNNKAPPSHKNMPEAELHVGGHITIIFFKLFFINFISGGR